MKHSVFFFSIIAFISSCNFKVVSTGSRLPGTVISGIVRPLSTSIVKSPSPISIDAYASPCSERTYARLYKIGADGEISISKPLSVTELDEKAYYSFDLEKLNITIPPSSTVSHIVLADGCNGEVYKRPVTNIDENQHIDAKTTVIAAVTNAGSEIKFKLNEIPKDQIQKLIDSVKGSTTTEVLASLANQSPASNSFSSLFGSPPEVLLETRPEVSLSYPLNALNENTQYQFKADTFHINPNYSTAYSWKLDGVVKSDMPNWNYVPDANAQGGHDIDVYVGRNDGTGKIDITKPYFSKRIKVVVNNSTPPAVPLIEIDPQTPSPRNTNSINLKLNTGNLLSNCTAFTALAITESASVPSSQDFSITCVQAGSQVVTANVGTGDGAKTLYVWAIDGAGTISASKSVNFIVDTTPPTGSISISPILSGGQTTNITLQAQDAVSGVDEMNISFSSDGGSTWNLIKTSATPLSSWSWTVPVIDTLTGKLKLEIKDKVGNSTVVQTSTFLIDSTRPMAPAFTIQSQNPTSSSVVQLTMAHCSDVDKIYVSTINVTPLPTDPSWQNCTTASGGHGITLSVDGNHTLYLWAIDSSKNISLTSSTASVTYDTTPPSFSINPTLSQPVLKGGATSTLSWSSQDLTTKKVSAAYSADNGATWTGIASNIADAGSLNWTTPLIDSPILVRVTLKDAVNFETSYTMNSKIDSTTPSVTVTSIPSIIRGSKQISVSYTISDTNQVKELKISYTTDGTNFSAPQSLTYPSTSSLWTSPGVTSSAVALKILATDEAGNVGSGLSNTFTVDSTPPNAPVISLASPVYDTDQNVSLTVGSCSDIQHILINEGNKPAEDDAAWVSCSTTPGSVAYVLATAVEGLHTLKAWSKDSAGNVSVTSTNTSVYLDSTPPTLSITTPGTPLKFGAQSFNTSLTELHTSSSQSISFELFNGSAWSSLGTKAVGNGPLSNVSYSFSATLPQVNTDQAKLRATFSDLAGRQTIAMTSNFKIDSLGPTPVSVSVNNGATTTANKNVLINMRATDLSDISSLCIKYNQITAPDTSDACWINLSSIGITSSNDITISNYPYQLGSLSGDYKIQFWFKDIHGFITTLSNSGNGVQGVDVYTISYSPDPSPTITNFIASSTDTPSNPLTISDTTVGIGTDVYIKWNITDNTSIPSGNVSLLYTTNDSTYQSIASSLSNTANNSCTLTVGVTGCYRWTAASPTSSYYRIKLVVTDQGGTSVFDVSNPLNTGSVKFLSGNTSLGIGGAATNAIILGENENSYTDYHDGQSFVVTRTGYIFLKYFTRGLAYISPTDGILRDLAPITGTSSGDGGNVSSATFKEISRMVIDYQDNILILDYDRVRKIDISTNPWKITTLFGGGSSNSDGAVGTSASISSDYVNSPAFGKNQITVTPDGKIYYNKGKELWFYDPADQLVKKRILLGGVGSGNMSGWQASFDNDVCVGSNTAFTFNKSTSAITKIIRRMNTSTSASCGSQSGGYPILNTNFNPSTGLAEAPHPPDTEWSAFKFTGLDGNIYVLNQGRATMTKYNPATNTFQTVIGTGANGRCADGTAALSCRAVIMSAFVSEYGKIYFLDLGVLRTIDSTGAVQTIAGQPRNFGIGNNPISARYSQINFFDVVGNDVYIKNELENQIVKFSLLGGNLAHIAGNTQRGSTVSNTDAKLSPLPNCGWSMPCSFVIDQSNNRLYHNSYSNGTVSYLDLTTNKWVDIASGLQDNYARISYLGLSSDGPLAYLSSHYGINGDKATLRVFNPTSNASTLILGQDTALTSLSQTICSGVNGTTCSFPATLGDAYQMRYKFDSVSSNWLLSLRGSTSISSIPSLGGTVNVYQTVANGIMSYDFYRGATDNFIFYCSTNGNLYKKNLTTNTETLLPLPISSMKCTSGSIFYSSSRNSLIFAYKQNNLGGIAEYTSP